jgi:hypothetical protein
MNIKISTIEGNKIGFTMLILIGRNDPKKLKNLITTICIIKPK